MAACPSPNPNTNCTTISGGCEFIACCKECACEIADGSGLQVAGEANLVKICSLPACSSGGYTCDNNPLHCPPDTDPALFCVSIVGDPGAHVELEDVSFDGTCFISVDKDIPVDTESQCT